jgi:hypothetical protein
MGVRRLSGKRAVLLFFACMAAVAVLLGLGLLLGLPEKPVFFAMVALMVAGYVFTFWVPKEGVEF